MVGAIALWSFSGLCFAEGGRSLGPMVFTTFACLVGSLTGTLFHIVRGGSLREIVVMPARAWIAGFFGIAVYTVVLALAFRMSPTRDLPLIALINYLWPVLMVILAGLLLHERGNARLAAAGVALGVAGVAVAEGPRALLRSPSALVPEAMALCAAFLWALYSVLLKAWKTPDQNNSSNAAFFLCAVLSAIVGGIRGEWQHIPAVTPMAVFWILFCGIGPIGIAYYLWELGVKRAPAQLVAAFSFFIPIFGTMVVALAFRESLSFDLVPAALFVGCGAYLAKRSTDPAR